jgi:SAM-dependent methyltransferase
MRNQDGYDSSHSEPGQKDLSRRTLAAYQGAAEEFWEGTRNHDVSQNRQALLGALEGVVPLSILDLGCGPGRDLKFFFEAGHHPVGLDGTPRFAEMAREYSGCEVWCQDFLELDLPGEFFHGVFANASLQHVPESELPRVLNEVRATLKSQGILLVSLPRGSNQQGFHGERYSCYWDLPTWQGFVLAAGFEEIEHYYRPTGKPREEQPWMVTVWQKLEA